MAHPATRRSNSSDEGDSSAVRPRRRHRPKESSNQSLLWTLLLTGLVFCTLDCLYIAHYVLRDRNASEWSDPSSMASPHSASHESSPANDSADDDDEHEVGLSRDEILQDPDRRHIVELLSDANINVADLDIHTLRQLPKFSQITYLYGEKPVFVGLETCRSFQQSPDPAEHFVSTAGTSG